MKKENSFVKAGAVLVLSGFVVKVLSAAYRIPLTRMLGANLMGKYSSVLNIFMPFFAFATAGITPCISRFTAQLNANQDNRGMNSLRKTAFALYIPISLAMTACFLLFGRMYSALQQDGIFFYGAVVLAPAIVLAAVETVYKGITQGKMNMMVTAKANVLESLVKTGFGLGAVYFIKNCMDSYPADLPVAACLGAVTVSGMICSAYLICASARKQPKTALPEKAKTINPKQLLAMSMPISASALVASGVSFFDTAVCLPVIKDIPYQDIVQSFSGASFMGAGEISMYLYGVYQGMVLTIFNLVPAVLASVGAAGMPVMTAAYSLKNKKRLSQQADKLFYITGAVSVPAAVFIFTFRSDIVQFLFGTTQAQTQVASQMLAIVVPFGVFSCFISAFNAVLNAHGRTETVFKILLSASVVRCIVSRITCAIPQINIKAFAVSAALFYTIIFVASIIAVAKSGIKFPFVEALLVPGLTAVLVMLALDVFTGTVR